MNAFAHEPHHIGYGTAYSMTARRESLSKMRPGHHWFVIKRIHPEELRQRIRTIAVKSRFAGDFDSVLNCRVRICSLKDNFPLRTQTKVFLNSTATVGPGPQPAS